MKKLSELTQLCFRIPERHRSTLGRLLVESGARSQTELGLFMLDKLERESIFPGVRGGLSDNDVGHRRDDSFEVVPAECGASLTKMIELDRARSSYRDLHVDCVDAKMVKVLFAESARQIEVYKSLADSFLDGLIRTGAVNTPIAYGSLQSQAMAMNYQPQGVKRAEPENKSWTKMFIESAQEAKEIATILHQIRNGWLS
ncbi:MAG: hypothetical protein ACREBU_05325 [Nitrososphaera sp.]